MYATGSLGFMLQGVSQQPQRVQPDGHVVEQINMQSDPNTGLSSRPGSELQLTTTGVPADTTHSTVAAGENLYRISTATGVLAAVGYDGTVFTISDPNTYIGYFGDNMAYYAQDDRIFCVNREVVVGTVGGTDVFGTDWGHVIALGGEFSRTYTVKINYSDGTTASASHTTPDADAVGAAAAIRPSAILAALKTTLDGVKKVSTTITDVNGQQLHIVDSVVDDFSITVDDDAGNTVMRGGKGKVVTFADVPEYARHRDTLRVTGESGTINDDTWLVFVSDNTETAGAGLGISGVWTETVDPDAAEALDLSTMPHALDVVGTTMTIVRPAWEGRRVGDADLNPTPSFVGKVIKDIAGFQSRIAVIAGPSAIMTRTDNNLDFYRRTATAVLATDPIDIRSAGEDDSVMEWLIPYDKNLIVAAKDGQFFISGSGSLTGSNAAMPRSSTFEMSTVARPVVAGQTVMLPYNARAYSGINEMLPTEEGTANTLESLNNVTKKYLRGGIVGMAASANANTLVVQTDADASRIYVYNFLWENNTKAQSAWHTWQLPDAVEHLYIRDSTVFVWTRNGLDTNLLVMKLDRPVSEEIGFHITGDYQTTVDTTVAIVLPRGDYKFIGLTDGSVYSAGRTITPLSITPTGSDFTYVLPAGVPAEVIAGVPVDVELRPNEAIASDWRGNKKYSDRLVVQKYLLDYVETGTLKVYMSSAYFGETLVVDNRIIPSGDDPIDSFGTAVRDGTLEVPWGEDSKLAQLIIRTSSLQPTTLVEVRWAGQLYKGRT